MANHRPICGKDKIMVCFNDWKEARKSIGSNKVDTIINYLSFESIWNALPEEYKNSSKVEAAHNIMFLVYEKLFIEEYNLDYNKLICDFMRCPYVTIDECKSLYEHFNFIKDLKEDK